MSKYRSSRIFRVQTILLYYTHSFTVTSTLACIENYSESNKNKNGWEKELEARGIKKCGCTCRLKNQRYVFLKIVKGVQFV